MLRIRKQSFSFLVLFVICSFVFQVRSNHDHHSHSHEHASVHIHDHHADAIKPSEHTAQATTQKHVCDDESDTTCEKVILASNAQHKPSPVKEIDFEVPLVDVDDFRSGDPVRKAAFVQKLGDAFRNIGFARLKNHGVKQQLIDELYRLSKIFFMMTNETKMKYHIVGGGGARGFTPFGREHAKGFPSYDLKEFLHFGREENPGDTYFHRYLPNVWPTELEEENFKGKVMSIFSNYDNTARMILSALALYMKLPEDFFNPVVKEGNSILRIIYYPPMNGSFPKDSVRAAAHGDINLITMLPTATEDGLQILYNHTWYPAKTLPGELIVDSGDMFERFTNRYIPATIHRVVNPEGDKQHKERMSMPFFCHPHSDAMLDAMKMPQYIRDAGPVIGKKLDQPLPPISAEKFLEQRLREIGLYG